MKYPKERNATASGCGIDLARLALRPREAARALGISSRLLWALTNTGAIPHIRLGRAVLYPVRELTAWLTKQAKSEKADGTT